LAVKTTAIPIPATLDVRNIFDPSSIVAVPSYKCKSCDEQFEKYIAFKEHLLHHHHEEICVYACGICTQIFYYSSELTHHEAAKHASKKDTERSIK
jgi:hypothetical protein